MRTLPAAMQALLNQGGPFIGDVASGGFVTVQPDWTLQEVSAGIATADASKLPFRWWQRLDNSQTEIVIPGVKSISTDRSTATDAGSATITIYNQTHDTGLGANRTPGQLGNPGYLTWGHGQPQAAARWNQAPNSWEGILIPNALLRVYEGWPGALGLADALAAGLVVITGTWLVDDVQVTNNGMLQLTCRDMGKLLVEQQTYLPLMPPAWYPLAYYRFGTPVTHDSPAVTIYSHSHPVATGPGGEGIKYITSIGVSADSKGYYLVGSDGAVFAFEVPFYGSRGDNTVTPVTVVAMAPDTTGLGYWLLTPQGAVASFGDAGSFGGATTDLTAPQTVVAMSNHPDGLGYWLVAGDGSVFAYGSATYHGGNPVGSHAIVDIQASHTGGGYWLLDAQGAIYAYGDASYHGGETLPMVAMAVDATGGGYWMTAADGGVFSFGDTAFYGSATGGLTGGQHVVDISSQPDGAGYVLVANDGAVFAYGSATYHGGTPAGAQPIVAIRTTPTGAGYWLTASDGAIYAYGDATYAGGSQPPPSHVDTAPMIALAVDPLNRGYWLASADGGVFAFGSVAFYGSASGGLTGGQLITGIAAHPDGRGYWLVANDGAVFAYGSATYHGGTPAGAHPIVDIDATPTGAGYWLLGSDGAIYAYGDATYLGGAQDTGKTFAGMASLPSGAGYWLATVDGLVYAYGAAMVQPANGTYVPTELADPIFGISPTLTGNGYLLVGGDGGVYSFGDAPFWGSLPGDFQFVTIPDGNIRDYTDIVRDLLRWAGFLAYGDGGDSVYGYTELSGTFPELTMPATIFDKQPVIDPINQIKEALGWIFFIYEDGSVFWGPPNWFVAGNLLQNGARTTVLPVIDESMLLTDYQVSYKDASVRSQVIVASTDPDFHLDQTISTTVVLNSPLLRGMIRPAMIINGAIATKAEQQFMIAEMIRHIQYALRTGTSTMWANPAIQINDQTRIFERQTAETFTHLVTGIHSNHDLDAGLWTYQVTSSWLPDDFVTLNTAPIVELITPVPNPIPPAGPPLVSNPPPPDPGGTGGTGGTGGGGGGGTVLPPPPSGGPIAGRFTTSGADIIGPDGNVFVPLGTNLNGPYIGPPTTRTPTLGLSSWVHAWGFNAIRLPTNPSPNANTMNADLDAIIAEYTGAGIVVILDYHVDIDTGGVTGYYAPGPGIDNQWAFWANRYKNNPYVWYEVQNEPGSEGPVSSQWNSMHRRVIDVIRGTGATNIIVCGGSAWGQDSYSYGAGFVDSANSGILTYGPGLVSTYGNIVFDFHVYGQWDVAGNQSGADAKMGNYVGRLRSAGLPALVGEVGAIGYADGATQSWTVAFTAVMHTCHSNGVGVFQWAGVAQAANQFGDEGFVLVSDGERCINSINSLTAPSNLSFEGTGMWALGHP